MLGLSQISHCLSLKEKRSATFLKILANAGSYGLFIEVNPERVGADKKTGKPARAKLWFGP